MTFQKGHPKYNSIFEYMSDEKMIALKKLYLAIFRRSVEKWIEELLEPKYQKILKFRFGLEDGNSHSLEETGKLFDVTRERIRQMEAKALDIIRQSIIK